MKEEYDFSGATRGKFSRPDAETPLTLSFTDLVKSRVEADPAFRQALFQEAAQTMLDGDVATAKSVLRDYTTPRSASSALHSRQARRQRA